MIFEALTKAEDSTLWTGFGAILTLRIYFMGNHYFEDLDFHFNKCDVRVSIKSSCNTVYLQHYIMEWFLLGTNKQQWGKERIAFVKKTQPNFVESTPINVLLLRAKWTSNETTQIKEF